jgi:hypothetical protein
MLALPSRNSNNLPRFSWLPQKREKVHHSRRMPQCYPGEQCASGGQKTHPCSSGRPCLPRGHNAVPQWERLHLFHRDVSYRCTAAHCSVGSFSGNSQPREPSLSPRTSRILNRSRIIDTEPPNSVAWQNAAGKLCRVSKECLELARVQGDLLCL